MKFHETPTSFSDFGKRNNKTPSDYYMAAARQYEREVSQGSSNDHFGDLMMRSMIYGENEWYQTKRPFFNVWPAISISLLNLDTDHVSLGNCCFPVETLSIQMPCGHEPIQFKEYFCGSIHCMPQKTSEWPFYMTTNWYQRNGTGKRRVASVCAFIDTTEKDIEVLYFHEKDKEPDRFVPRSELMKCFRLVVAIGLMANDPEIVQPVVLKSDELKYEETHNERLVEKAIQRGRFGWNVGKAIEYMPHYRRPHFGLRWTGEGRLIPKIVPISGSIVKREKMTDVPTGYLDSEENQEK